MSYAINEIFYSIQGEGVRAGTANVFIRFAGCNLKCAVDDEHSGFDCDTEFRSKVMMDWSEICATLQRIAPNCKNVILTGGEPLLQVDGALLMNLNSNGYYIAVETNGTRKLPASCEHLVNWLCVSPKSAEHTIRIREGKCFKHGDEPENIQANELKYVRRLGQGIPKPVMQADHYLISPAFEPDARLARQTLDYCISLVKENPKWRLSVQQHKIWNVR